MIDLRAPTEDGAILAVPPLHDAERLLVENSRVFNQTSLQLFGMSLAQLREQVRRDVHRLTIAFLSGEDATLPQNTSSRIIVCGHQPELFHPGVWIKHFAIHGLARKYDCAALNLIIDNDAPKSAFLRIPIHDVENPNWRRLAYDRWQAGLAYEELPVSDETMFAEFGARADSIVAEWNFPSMLPDFWERVRRSDTSNLLGDRVSAARRETEREWGCHNLELPMRQLCEIDGFRFFAGHLFANLPEFHRLYNEVLSEYRLRHGLRSRNHPVPDLARDGDWYETPFWAWRTGEIRQRVWGKIASNRIKLRIDAVEMPCLFIDSETALRESWSQLDDQGFKIRTRALTTTLFARMFVAELFIHGIGGAKYDELTDELIRRFYKMDAPRFMILSATLRLPFPRMDATSNDCRQLRHVLRDMHWNPQRHFSSNLFGDMVAEKERWIAKSCASKALRRERYRMLRSLTEQLRSMAADQIGDVQSRLKRCEAMVAANDIFGRRDYAFCLYPETKLRELFDRVMP